MDAERRRQIEDLFDAALDQDPAERAEYLEEACGTDAELLAEVQALLAAHERMDGALDRDVAGVAAALLTEPAAEERIGPYRVVGEVGAGGMGVVYLAERDDGQYRRQVAIKIIRGGPAPTELHRRFLAERQILAFLEHPNIAGLLDGGISDDGRPYLVLEYVDGLPIDVYCDRNRLTIEERLRLFCTVARAVQHAHRRLVVHRDLKPSNVFVTADGVVKLLDFGIAKILDPALLGMDGDAPLTRTGLRLMTPEYASPEQVRGESASTANDIWAMGALLYELLTGRRPFALEGRSAAESERIILEVDPPRPSTVVGGLDRTGERGDSGARTIGRHRRAHPERLRRILRGDLDRIVLTALRKEPERRYASAEQMAEDIERYLEGLPILAHEDSRGYRLGKFVRRHRVETLAASLVAVAMLGGTGVALWQAGVAGVERARAERALHEAELALDQSREVTAFLMGMFDATDPASARGVAITARELLERGVARSEELAHQPLLQAQMFDVVGRVYRSLGEYPRAHDLLERSLALRRQYTVGDDPALAETLHDLAELLRREARYDEAEPLYFEALEMQRRTLGAEHTSVASTLGDLGLLYHNRGEYDLASRYYEEALAMRRRLLGSDHEQTIAAEARVGVLLRDRGDRVAADTVLRRTLAARLRLFGEAHPDVASNVMHLASIQAGLGENARADSLFREALEIRRRIYGPDHPEVAQSMMQVAAGIAQRGQHAEAEQLYREAYAMERRLHGDMHPSIANAMNSLALFLRSRGDLASAEQLFRDAIEISLATRGPDHPHTATALGNLARTRVIRGDTAEGEALLRRALAIRRKALGPNHSYVASFAASLGDLVAAQNRPTEAVELYREALDIHQQRNDTVAVGRLRERLSTFLPTDDPGQLARRPVTPP